MADKRLRVDITAKDRTRAAFSRVQRSLGALKKSLFSVKGLIGAAFGVLAVRSITRFVTKTVQAADAIAKTSRAIGISSDKLQELRFAADLSGVSVATLDSAMLGFSKRVGEARAGTGTLFTILNKTDEALLANVQSAGSVDEAFDLITQAANAMGNEMDKSALLSAAFGRTAGTAFKNLVPDVERLSQKARDLGLIIDKGLLEKAEATNDAMSILGTTVTVELSTAILKNADAIQELVTALTAAVPKIIEFGKGVLMWVGLLDAPALRPIDELANKMSNLADEITRLQNQKNNRALLPQDMSGGLLGFEEETAAEIDRLIAKYKRLEFAYGMMVSNMARIQATAALATPIEERTVKNTEKQVSAHQRYADQLVETAPLLGRWREEMAKATREAEVQKVAMRDLSTSIETTLIDSLADLTTSFKDWRDVARAALRDVIRSMLQFISVQASMGAGGAAAGGGIGSLIFKGLSGLFGPSTATPTLPANFTFRQAGGPLSAGQAAIVGEGGPELFVPRAAGQVVPNHALGGSVTVNQTINLSTGLQATVRAEVMGMLPQIAATTKSAVLSARVRGGAFASAFEG